MKTIFILFFIVILTFCMLFSPPIVLYFTSYAARELVCFIVSNVNYIKQ
jgi:hypothetical protein